MSTQIELIMPKMGESIAEATILKWLKKEGDTIDIDEAVLEIATDKVDSEVPSPVAGTLTKLLFAENDVVSVGKAIAIIEIAGNGKAAPSNAGTDVAGTVTSQPVDDRHQSPVVAATQAANNDNQDNKQTGDRFYSPLVLNIARSEGISMSDLETLNGTGQNGRVTKKDILAHVQNKGNQPVDVETKDEAPVVSTIINNTTSSPAVQHKAPEVQTQAGDEIIEMDRMRKLIADHMVMSLQVSPHVTSFVEADVTNLVMWREKNKKDFEKREGEKITFTPIFIEAVVKAIKDFPNINVSVSGDKIIKRKAINIGMAAALPSGNLIVPVIKNADNMNLIGLTKSVNSLANRARTNTLKPDDIQGGTFTLTNVGTFGNVMGTPIINQPQVAILAVGAIKKKPVVLETLAGDVIAIRHMMFLSLSYDHRVVDGMLGGSFLRKVADYLEAFELDRVL
ncbi:MAG: dihydrolipoamide acetyltransferase family protein [Bacteroidota bacterium]|nr:dihydrolipoamide acetyltransferase family protein [Bacteroidota bacterium]